jgi:hypothetical protein
VLTLAECYDFEVRRLKNENYVHYEGKIFMLRSYAHRRPRYLVAALVLASSSVLPLIFSQKASAYNILPNREIKVSSSATSSTSVSYYVEFDAGTTANVKSIAVDFCANTAVINDTCTANPGTTTPTLTSATVTTTGAGVGNLTGTWTVAITNTNRTFTISNATGESMTAGTPYFFTINLVTNPSTLGSFYGRILTFPNDTTSNYAGGYTGTNVDTNIPTDAGGIALSTAAQITVTSKVQERLTFCVYADTADAEYGNNDCTSKQGTSVLLGDTNGVLDPSGPYVSTATRYSITTNATGGATIRLKGGTLTSGANSIDAMTATANTSTPGTEEFGFCTYQQAGTGLTPAAPYDDGTCDAQTSHTSGTGTPGGAGTATFAYDTNSTDGTGSTFGDTIGSKVAGNFSTAEIAFIGNIGNATEAGIYTAVLTFIATGTY